MIRYKVAITISLGEFTMGVNHKHKIMGRVLEFGDSATDSSREYDRLEREILKLLDKKE